MDIAQIEQMVSWLDEQRRRADQDIRQLEQRLVNQMGVIEEQARRIQQLESELAAARAQLAEYTSLQQAMENLRNEVRHMVERLEEERLARERDQERLRAAEREKLGRDLAELRKELERIRPLEEELEARKVEERRLGENLMRLRQSVTEIERRLEEAVRNNVLLQEQRAQDHRRIGQLQGETVELFRRLETTVNKLALLEEKVQRQESTLKNVAQIAEDLRQEEQTFLEEVRRAEVDRQKTMEQWGNVFERIEAEMEEALKRLEVFQLQYEKAVQAVADIERWQAELRRDVHEAREAQRVAEERMRNQIREFESEQEKRWKKQILEWDYRWQEADRRTTALDQKITQAHKLLALHRELLDVLWRLQEEWGSHQLGEAQRLLQLIEGMAEKRERILKEQEGEAASSGT